MNKPLTPTHHGAWRVIDGRLVDESKMAPDAVPVQTEPTAVATDGGDAPPAPKSRKASNLPSAE